MARRVHVAHVDVDGRERLHSRDERRRREQPIDRAAFGVFPGKTRPHVQRFHRRVRLSFEREQHRAVESARKQHERCSHGSAYVTVNGCTSSPSASTSVTAIDCSTTTESASTLTAITPSSKWTSARTASTTATWSLIFPTSSES